MRCLPGTELYNEKRPSPEETALSDRDRRRWLVARARGPLLVLGVGGLRFVLLGVGKQLLLHLRVFLDQRLRAEEQVLVAEGVDVVALQLKRLVDRLVPFLDVLNLLRGRHREVAVSLLPVVDRDDLVRLG